MYAVPHRLGRRLRLPQQQYRQRPAAQQRQHALYHHHHRSPAYARRRREIPRPGQASSGASAHSVLYHPQGGDGVAGLKKKLAQVGQEALERLELPVNIAAGVARIELLGNRELYMDRHRGVLAYTTEAVDVNGGGVVVRVRGQGLQLLVMTEQELRITGKISGIELVE
ncbi:MAG: hypothetical protein EGQ29_05765 [Clostridiales bacterium]|nr:hypothetical protein [Clostridiales bacterium]